MYDENVDYKELYLKMVRATEDAMNLLIKAQQECEELYLQQTEPTVDFSKETAEGETPICSVV
ncbi:MAG: hypothetical protein PUC06_02540 [Oscillospiraceae bacterium]|nr:hypothetical protein [Oscillospiraceae bacterium]